MVEIKSRRKNNDIQRKRRPTMDDSKGCSPFPRVIISAPARENPDQQSKPNRQPEMTEP
jgi:hypothetical protein